MTNLNPPTLTREQINCQIRKLKEASPDQSINGMQGWMLSFEEIDSLVKWAADMELEACCEWFREFYKTESWGKRDLGHFRAARRPKPPSEKEQALEALERIDRYAVSQMRAYTFYDELIEDVVTILRALKDTPEVPQ